MLSDGTGFAAEVNRILLLESKECVAQCLQDVSQATLLQVWKLQPGQWMLFHRTCTPAFIVCTHCSYGSHPMASCNYATQFHGAITSKQRRSTMDATGSTGSSLTKYKAPSANTSRAPRGLCCMSFAQQENGLKKLRLGKAKMCRNTSAITLMLKASHNVAAIPVSACVVNSFKSFAPVPVMLLAKHLQLQARHYCATKATVCRRATPWFGSRSCLASFCPPTPSCGPSPASP